MPIIFSFILVSCTHVQVYHFHYPSTVLFTAGIRSFTVTPVQYSPVVQNNASHHLLLVSYRTGLSRCFFDLLCLPAFCFSLIFNSFYNVNRKKVGVHLWSQFRKVSVDFYNFCTVLSRKKFLHVWKMSISPKYRTCATLWKWNITFHTFIIHSRNINCCIKHGVKHKVHQAQKIKIDSH